MRNLKRVLSLALALVMVLGVMVIGASAASFTDADEITYTEAIDVMAGLGVFEGDNGALKPTEILTRKEAAVIIARIILGKSMADSLVPTKQIFDDVPLTANTEWYAAEVEYCNNINMIVGHNGKFDPDGQLTGTAFAKLLLVAMGHDAAAQGYEGKNWDTNINADALRNGLNIKGVNINAPLTREGAAQMLLQALECDMVYYDNYYDYATGAPIKAGPYAEASTKAADYDLTSTDTDKTLQFAEEFFPKLKKTTADDDFWGRPAVYSWKNNNKTLYTEWYAPVAVYTEAVVECDVAEELGLEEDTAIAELTVNAVEVTKASQIKKLFNNDLGITPLATKDKIGAQGRLTEIYETAKGYEVVMIDTYLAQVVEVTEAEYDRNGHVDEYATVTFAVYTKEGVTTDTWYDDVDFDFTEGEMLLVYAQGDSYDAKNIDSVVAVLGTPDSLIGGQTAFTTKASHIVEDEEYLDAFQFNLDEADRSVADHVWYFDTYGNLIGVTDYVVYSASTYGVISSIYWRDSYDGEDGYAKAVITYMDGSEEDVVIYSIDGVVLEGVEGKNAVLNKTTAKVASTKSYNSCFVRYGLYKITEDSKGRGLVLTSQAKLAEPAKLETGVPAMNDELNAGKSTQFLIWNYKTEEYETYTGIKNVPNYDEKVRGYYVDAKKDGVADYVFIWYTQASYDSETEKVLYYWDGSMEITSTLNYKKDNEIYSWTIEGGYVNNEPGEISILLANESLLKKIEKREGKLLLLTLTDGYVTKVNEVKDEPVEIKIDGTKYYAVMAGAVDNDTAWTGDDATLVDEVLTVANGDVYYTEDLVNEYTYNYDLVKTLKKDDDAYLYVVYTVGKTGFKNADTIYITDKCEATAVVTTATALAQAFATVEDGTPIVLAANIELTEAWTPVGDKDAGIYFTGTLDGNGYTISGLEVSDGDYVALISAAKDATIKNLTVEGTVEGDNAAGIVARVEGNTMIENCVNNVTVAGTTKAGGIACNVTGADAKIINCVNNADISWSNEAVGGVGGIVGYVNNNAYLEITDCTNNGDVTSEGNTYAGAAVGYAAGTSEGKVTGFTNTGVVTGTLASNNRFLKDGETVLCGYVGTPGNWIAE